MRGWLQAALPRAMHGRRAPEAGADLADRIDHDVLYWNANSLLRSLFFAAKKRSLALSAAVQAAKEGWDVFNQEDIPPPFHAVWARTCDDGGSLGALLAENLQGIAFADTNLIIAGNATSKLAKLLLAGLDWAVDIQAFWHFFRSLGVLDLVALENALSEASAEFERLQNGRPRLLFREDVGRKNCRVSLEYYRADITDIAFEEGDSCFFLLSKFADQRLCDMLKEGSQMAALGALMSKYDALRDHAQKIHASGATDDYVEMIKGESSHQVYVLDLPASCNLPFKLGIVDVCDSQSPSVDVEGLYFDLRCLDKVLSRHGITHLLTVLTGYGTTAHQCFQKVEVADVLEQMSPFLNYMARQCRSLRHITVATFNLDTANKIRRYLSDGEVVSEHCIDYFTQTVGKQEVDAWLVGHSLKRAVEGLVDKAMQTTDKNSKDYHCQLCLEMRGFVGRLVDNFLLEELGIREAYVASMKFRFNAEVHLMAGQVCHWMKENCRSISQGEDRAKLANVCELIIRVNKTYINPGLHKENLTDERLQALEAQANKTFYQLAELIGQCVPWTPTAVPPKVLRQLAGASPSAPAAHPRSPSSSQKPQQKRPGPQRETLGPEMEAEIRIQTRSGPGFRVPASSKYMIRGRWAPVCELFKTGRCAQAHGACRLAHPCRLQAACARRDCKWDHPAEVEAADEGSDAGGENSPSPSYELFGVRVAACTFFQKSRCRYGDKCKFVHPCADGANCRWSACSLYHPIL